jgi:hypothetical protein
MREDGGEDNPSIASVRRDEDASARTFAFRDGFRTGYQS